VKFFRLEGWCEERDNKGSGYKLVVYLGNLKDSRSALRKAVDHEVGYY
jgi:hypothetical protein